MFQTKPPPEQVEREARRRFDFARAEELAWNLDEARQQYAKIIKQSPQTTAAAEARRRLETLKEP
jgi:hypothetical protein